MTTFLIFAGAVLYVMALVVGMWAAVGAGMWLADKIMDALGQ